MWDDGEGGYVSRWREPESPEIWPQERRHLHPLPDPEPEATPESVEAPEAVPDVPANPWRVPMNGVNAPRHRPTELGNWEGSGGWWQWRDATPRPLSRRDVFRNYLKGLREGLQRQLDEHEAHEGLDPWEK